MMDGSDLELHFNLAVERMICGDPPKKDWWIGKFEKMSRLSE